MIFGESRVKDWYRKAMWGPGMSIATRLPATWEQRVFRLLGRSAGHLARRKRKEVDENLRRVFSTGHGDNFPAIDTVVGRAFASHFANQYVGPTFLRCTRSTWSKYLSWEGLDHLAAAEQEDCGVVLAHPHMGPAQLPLHVLGLMGKDVTQVGGGRVTRIQLSDVGEWARNRRLSYESNMSVKLHDGRSYLRPLLRSLASGGIVLTAMDGTGGGKELGRRQNCMVLGHSMPMPLGPVWLALHGNARLHPLHCYRSRSGSSLYTAVIGSEIRLNRDLPPDDGLKEGVGRLAIWLDSVLRDHPGDWLFWDGFAPGALLP